MKGIFRSARRSSTRVTAFPRGVTFSFLAARRDRTAGSIRGAWRDSCNSERDGEAGMRLPVRMPRSRLAGDGDWWGPARYPPDGVLQQLAPDRYGRLRHMVRSMSPGSRPRRLLPVWRTTTAGSVRVVLGGYDSSGDSHEARTTVRIGLSTGATGDAIFRSGNPVGAGESVEDLVLLLDAGQVRVAHRADCVAGLPNAEDVRPGRIRPALVALVVQAGLVGGNSEPPAFTYACNWRHCWSLRRAVLGSSSAEYFASSSGASLSSCTKSKRKRPSSRA